MPSGAKKRKALKKKEKEQETIGTSTSNKGLNTHGNDEHGSQAQEEGESDGNLNSPGSQGNEEFWTRDPSPSPLSGLGKLNTGKEKTEDADVTTGQGEDVIAVERETGHDENGVDNVPSYPFPENVTHNTIKAASQEARGSGISVLDSVKPVDSPASKVVISVKNEQVDSSDSIIHESDENVEKRRLKEGNIPGSSADTSKEIKSVKEPQVPECSEEKSLLPSGPPVIRTSWLSCCGLFDVMAPSER